MIKTEKLELLALAKDFTVNVLDDGYEVKSDRCELSAVISNVGFIDYYRNGVSNSYYDDALIDVDELLRLKEFVEALTK